MAKKINSGLTPVELLKTMFELAVDAVHPKKLLHSYLPHPPKGKTYVTGAGKASAAMAQVLEKNWPSPLSGLVVTQYGYKVECEQIEVIEAAHPISDDQSFLVAKTMMRQAQMLSADDLMISLISGGGSALLCYPANGISLAEKQKINEQLLRCGATIHEINTLRKHLSSIKAGRLALASWPAKVCTLIISDIPGDDRQMVASGPTLGDSTTLEQALSIVKKYQITIPGHIEKRLCDENFETPKPDDEKFKDNEAHIIASAQHALQAASVFAQEKGYQTTILSDSIQGRAEDVAAQHADITRQILSDRLPAENPCIMLSGGETSVEVTGNGKGGRNSHFLLSLLKCIGDNPHVYAIACDTDGIDGVQDNAGCYITPDTFKKAQRLGLSIEQHLQENNAYEFFFKLDQLIMSGPTYTNVNDFRAILIR